MFLIHDGNAAQFAGEREDGFGLVPRDYAANPVGSYENSKPFDNNFTLIPESEWAERCADMEANKSRLSDIRNIGANGSMIPNLDQGQKGYCWAHSPTHAVMLARAVMNQPYVPLSAYAVACKIKNFRDEGAWGALALDFIIKNGVPSQLFWPQLNMSRTNDTADTWEDAAKHKVSEAWIDTAAAVYDRTLSWQQNGTLLLSRCPGFGDFNWWGHSVNLMDLVNGNTKRDVTRADSGKLATTAEFELFWGVGDPVTKGFGLRILNSWLNWGENGNGTAVLTGSKAVPNGGGYIRVTTAS